jgi:N-methylhydantoinase A
VSSTQLGVDVGGTFTDVVLERPNATPVVHKVSTTPDEPLVGVIRGISEACRRADISIGNLDRIVHGTTLVANTILEQRGESVVLVTTRGFRDLPTLGRGSVVESARYDLFARPDVPPLPLTEVIEVDERIDGRGRVREAPGAEEVRRLAAAVADSPAQAVAVTFMNAYLRGDHEQQVAQAIREATDRPVFVSSELSPLPGEYDRLVTTVLSASLSTVVGDYLMRLSDLLESEGFTGRLEVMDASGGCISTTEAARTPVRLIESGGAAAVTGAAIAAEETRSGDAVAFDMGGTTAKAAVVRDRRPQLTNRFQLGGTGSFGTSRVGTGLPITVPVVDLAEIGAGGGSVAWIDEGTFRLGPRSAGARPGPICYGRGGTEVTVTDAAAHLGYIDPDSFADGIKLELGATADSLARLGEPLGHEPDSANRSATTPIERRGRCTNWRSSSLSSRCGW